MSLLGSSGLALLYTIVAYSVFIYEDLHEKIQTCISIYDDSMIDWDNYSETLGLMWR